MRFAFATSIAGLALLAAGCGEKDEEPAATPSHVVVAHAARDTYDADTLALRLKVQGRTDAYRVEGIEQPSRGRFRVAAHVPGAPPASQDFDERVGVVGTDGEGNETTHYVKLNLIGRNTDRDERCWFNPHSGVGFPGRPLSVEESVRVIGSVLESLRSEIATARAADGLYVVRLAAAASHPRNDFDGSQQRVWGARNLLAFDENPIDVSVQDGRIDGLVLSLGGYKPAGYFPGSRPQPQELRIAARFRPIDERLVLNPPNCLAVE